MADTHFTIKNDGPPLTAWARTSTNGSGTYTVEVYLDGCGGGRTFGYRIYCKMGQTTSAGDIARSSDNVIKDDTKSTWSDNAYSKVFSNVPYGEVIGFRTGNTSSGAGAFNRNIGLNYDTYPAPTNVSINPIENGKGSVNLQRYWQNASYCKYQINDWGWIDENTSYPNGVHVSGDNVTNLDSNTEYTFQIRMGNFNSGTVDSNIATCRSGGANPIIHNGTVTADRDTCTFSNFTAELDGPNSGDGKNKIKSRRIDYCVVGGEWITGDEIIEPEEPEPIILTNLTPITTYNYKYYITDIYNHTGVSEIGSFNTTYNKPIIEPIGNEEGNSKIIPITSTTNNGGGFSCVIEAKGDAREEGDTDYAPISKYYLYYKKRKDSASNYIPYPTNGSNSKNITITNLETDIEYNCYFAVTNIYNDTVTTAIVTKATNRIPPIIHSVNTTVDGITISVTTNVRNPEDNLYYSFKLDNEHEWTEPQLSNTYTWTGLAELTTYPIKIKVIAKSSSQYGQDVESAVWTENVKTDVDQAKVRIKTSGNWIEGKLFIKKDNQWVKAKRVYIKKNNQWVIGKNQIG